MSGLLRLVREVHRRSLWQVLAVYLAGSWVALQVVDHLTRTAGLPDWVSPFALVLLVVGLPIVLATAVVQEGVGPSSSSIPPESAGPPSREFPPGGVGPPSRESPSEAVGPPSREAPSGAAEAPVPGDGGPGAASRSAAHSFLQDHLTWKRAWIAGLVGFALLGLVVTAYFAMRAAGVGPVASLVAQGVLDDREPILLAEFRNATGDPLLGSVITEALRIDLASSQAIALVEAPRIREALGRMERDPASPLTAELAREVALRDGIKAVLEGEAGAAGSGFILSATLRAAEDGATLATFRRTAAGDHEVIRAIDRLSQDIREKVGESLRSIRQGGALQEVTTPSLEALRKYTEAEQHAAGGDEAGALALLDEAIALDPEFAMAYRKQAVIFGNLGIEPARQREAVERAYRHRARLTQVERYLTEALYHDRIAGDLDAVLRAYEAALRTDPDNSTALNNLALQYMSMDELERAKELLVRALEGPSPGITQHMNLIAVLIRQGRSEEAREALDVFRSAYPHEIAVRELAFWVHAFQGDPDAAYREVRDVPEMSGVSPIWRLRAQIAISVLDAAHGRLEEARAGMEWAVRVADGIDPALGQFHRNASVWLELAGPGDPARALTMLRDPGYTAALQAVPGEARDYPATAVLFLAAGDPAGAEEWLEGWRSQVPAAELPRGDRSLRTFLEAWARSDGDDLGGALEALDAHRSDVRCPSCLTEVRALLLERTGRTEEAREAWRAILAYPGDNHHLSYLLRPVALEHVARLSDELGDADTAMEAYGRLIELWADADAELEPRLERARERLAELEAGAGAGTARGGPGIADAPGSGG